MPFVFLTFTFSVFQHLINLDVLLLLHDCIFPQDLLIPFFPLLVLKVLYLGQFLHEIQESSILDPSMCDWIGNIRLSGSQPVAVGFFRDRSIRP
jgi:hypothetical protein